MSRFEDFNEDERSIIEEALYEYVHNNYYYKDYWKTKIRKPHAWRYTEAMKLHSEIIPLQK